MNNLKEFKEIILNLLGRTVIVDNMETAIVLARQNSYSFRIVTLKGDVINPSGATGFGQEFSARHVNTAGNGPADDIVEGTKQFCKEHSFVDASKIGCIGASYGGFTTMYLQTITDIFAAAISHAGISDHTSYWGEGYWGYSYSEVSMANSYPWSETDLYVKQSPLYNAHKVKTPILFVHGDADTNVPVGESIQMYTALKLLGKETDMVLVTSLTTTNASYGRTPSLPGLQNGYRMTQPGGIQCTLQKVCNIPDRYKKGRPLGWPLIFHSLQGRLIQFEHCHKCTLRNLNVSYLGHTAFTFFLLFKEFSLT